MRLVKSPLRPTLSISRRRSPSAGPKLIILHLHRHHVQQRTLYPRQGALQRRKPHTGDSGSRFTLTNQHSASARRSRLKVRSPSLASFYHDNLLTHYPRIQDALLHALNSHSTNWPTAIQSHALALLRSGEVTTFPALLSRVLEDVRHDSALNPISSSSNGTSAKPATNGDAPKTNGAADAKPSLAVPESVIEEALRVTRESLEAVCDIEDEGTA